MGGAVEEFIDNTINAATQVSTAGTVGYKGGSFGTNKGVVTSGVKDVVKDITGATAAEEANKLARQQFEQAKADAEKARKDAEIQSARDQVTASRLAGGVRGGISTVAPKGASRFSTLGSDEKDFLGL